jgi:glycerol-3-phosphate dehydrogenase
MPIVEEMYRILYEDRSPGDAWTHLMSRPLISEDGGPS